MTLYKISAFSRLGQVSIKALRLYDQRDLLKPAQVDADTGYRYYKIEQLSRLHRILALKAMGLSLEQIGQLLNDDLSLNQIQAMLRLKQTELQQQLIEAQHRLTAVSVHLKYLQEEQTMPDYEVILKPVESVQHVASIRDTIPAYNAIGQLFGEIMAYLGQNRAEPQGYCAAIWHSTEYQETEVDAEAMIAIPQNLPGTQRIQVQDLPALDLVAAVIHRGSYNTLNQAYGAIVKWIEDNGYQIAGYNREIYLQGGAEQDNPDYVTEIQFPVVKVAV
ncbi:MAG: MerR family transcriptional regulator [Leptolyngbya sp. SIO1D8]|nr:MerR family transcriptional regulator [Leptolyngbya sp. SIO1D8]